MKLFLITKTFNIKEDQISSTMKYAVSQVINVSFNFKVILQIAWSLYPLCSVSLFSLKDLKENQRLQEKI